MEKICLNCVHCMFDENADPRENQLLKGMCNAPIPYWVINIESALVPLNKKVECSCFTAREKKELPC